MVLALDPQLSAAMFDGKHDADWIVDVSYDGFVTAPGLPLAPLGSVTFAAGSNIQASGRLYLTSDVRDPRGRLLTPRAITDTLAPFGQEVEIRRRISTGGTTLGVVPLGRFRLREVPLAAETARRLGASFETEAVELELVVVDRFEAVEADDFTLPEAPRTGTTWAEIRRLSPFPIALNPTLADRPIPSTLVYTGNRLDAMQLLASNLEGELAMTRQGAITVRPIDPYAAGLPVTDLSGTIQTLRSGMSNSLTNVVVVTGRDPATNDPVIGVARVETGPLRWNGPMGARVRRIGNPLATSQAAANASARTWLFKLSNAQARLVRCVCLPHPELELGDPVKATDPGTGETVTGIVDRMTFSMDATDLMDVDILIPREVIPWV